MAFISQEKPLHPKYKLKTPETPIPHTTAASQARWSSRDERTPGAWMARAKWRTAPWALPAPVGPFLGRPPSYSHHTQILRTAQHSSVPSATRASHATDLASASLIRSRPHSSGQSPRSLLILLFLTCPLSNPSASPNPKPTLHPSTSHHLHRSHPRSRRAPPPPSGSPASPDALLSTGPHLATLRLEHPLSHPKKPAPPHSYHSYHLACPLRSGQVALPGPRVCQSHSILGLCLRLFHRLE